MYINFYQHIHFQYNFSEFDDLHSSSHSFLMYITDLISVILLVFMAILYTTTDALIFFIIIQGFTIQYVLPAVIQLFDIYTAKLDI